ncbi:1570_t:CDS:1, partial [Gigaspora rosea]
MPNYQQYDDTLKCGTTQYSMRNQHKQANNATRQCTSELQHDDTTRHHTNKCNTEAT